MKDDTCILGDRVEFSIPFSKVDAETGTVEGFATVDVFDQDKDRIPLEVAKAAFEEAGAMVGVDEMHDLRARGTYKTWWEAETPQGNAGIMNRVKLSQTPDGRSTLQKCLELALKGFSIQGRVKAFHFEGGGRVIDKMQLLRVSLVDVPCNQEAVFTNIVKVWHAPEDEDDTPEAYAKVAIPRKTGAPQTAPHGRPKGQNVDNYADPTNYAWPIDSKARTRSAMSYFNGGRGRDKYTPEEWQTIGKRIAAKATQYFQADYELAGDRVQPKEKQATAKQETERMDIDISKGLSATLAQIDELLADGSPEAIEQARQGLAICAETCGDSSSSESTDTTEMTAKDSSTPSTPSTSTGSTTGSSHTTPSTSTGSTSSTPSTTASTPSTSTGHTATTETTPSGSTTTVVTKAVDEEVAKAISDAAPTPAGFENAVNLLNQVLDRLNGFISAQKPGGVDLSGLPLSKTIEGDIPPADAAPASDPVLDWVRKGNLTKATEAANGDYGEVIRKASMAGREELIAAGGTFRPMLMPIGSMFKN
jgi:hypothetical protein